MKPGWVLKGVLAAGAVFAMTCQAFAGLDGPAPLAWRWSPQSQGVPDGSPVVTDAGVFAANGNRVYGIDRDTGNTLWRFPYSEPLNARVASPLGLSGENLICGLEDGSLLAVDTRSGKQVWRVNLEAKMTTAPVSTAGVILMGIGPGEILAVKASDGTPLWPKPYHPSEAMNPYLQATDGAIFFMSGRTLTCLDVLSGKPRYTPKVFAQYGGNFNVVGDKVYVSTGNFITVLRASDGRKVWEHNVPEVLSSAPGADDDFVVGVSRSGNLYAFDNTGKPVFKKGVALGATTRYAPVVVGNTATVTTQSGTISMVNIQTGEIKWNTVIRPAILAKQVVASGLAARGNREVVQTAKQVEYVQAAGAPVLAGDSLFVLARDGTMLAYDKTNGVDLTPPEVRMVFPYAGDLVAGKAPMTILFKLEDLGVGVAPDSVKVTINDAVYAYKLNTDGYLEVNIAVDKKNPQIKDGRARVVVDLSDWLGNKTSAVFALTIDNLLPALGGPKKLGPTTNPGIPGVPGGMPPPGGGDGGGDGGGGGGGR